MQIDFDWLEDQLDSSLTKGERKDLQDAIEVVFVSEGMSIIHQHSIPEALFFLQSGNVEVHGRGVNGQDIMFSRNNRLKVLGEISFFSGQPASASVIADHPCILYRIGRDAFEQLMREQPALVMKIFSLIVRNMGEVILRQDAKIRT
jgi:CRP-like cAMP-binding protein